MNYELMWGNLKNDINEMIVFYENKLEESDLGNSNIHIQGRLVAYTIIENYMIKLEVEND